MGSQAIGQEPRNLTKSLKCSHFYPPSSVNPFAVKLKRKEDLVDNDRISRKQIIKGETQNSGKNMVEVS